MDIIAWIIVGIFCIAFIVSKNSQQREEQREERKRKLRIAEREKKEQANNAYQGWLIEMEEQYGNLTKSIPIDEIKMRNIHIFEKSKTIFIKGEKYSFKDIISCNIERIVTKGKVEKHITAPDEFEMAKQQLLYGMGQKYNVTSTTHIETTPDKVKYMIYIGLNSLSAPQISLSTVNSEKANEIQNLMNIIIQSNQNS